MYSPAALALEAARGAGEEAEVVGADRHLVARVRRAACRRSATRAAASSSACSSITSASLSSTSARSPGVVSRHSGSACLAASTARSTSASVPARHLGDRLARRRVERPPSSRRRRRRPTRRRRSSCSSRRSRSSKPPRLARASTSLDGAARSAGDRSRVSRCASQTGIDRDSDHEQRDDVDDRLLVRPRRGSRRSRSAASAGRRP